MLSLPKAFLVDAAPGFADPARDVQVFVHQERCRDERSEQQVRIHFTTLRLVIASGRPTIKTSTVLYIIDYDNATEIYDANMFNSTPFYFCNIVITNKILTR